MATKIKGILIEIGADTSGLDTALSKANSSIRSLGSEFSKINKTLKLDPSNTELLAQKQKILGDEIASVSTKLKTLKDTQRAVENSGKTLSDSEQANYRAIQREIVETEYKLKQLQVQASSWTQAGEKLKSFSENISKIGSAFTSLGTKLSATVTAPIVALGTAGITYNAQIEKYQRALTTLTGSSQEAQRIIEQIKTDAKATPFDVAGLTQANQLLISTGLSADESRDTILALGNAISATGGGNEELSRMAVNLQQIKNVGKASALDIKQFAYAGIDVYGLLADYLGTTKEEASQMKVTWEDLNGALINASKQGGKYFGAMEEQSETTTAKVERLKESFNDFSGKLTESLVPTVQSIIDKLSELLNSFGNLNPHLQEIVTKVLLVSAIIPPILIIVGQVITAVGTIAGAIGSLSAYIGATIVGTTGLSTVLMALINPITIVIGVLGGLVAVFISLYNKNEEFRNKVNETWLGIQNLFNEHVKPLIDEIGNLIAKLIDDIIEILKKLWNWVEPFVKRIFDWLMNIWNGFLKDIVQIIFDISSKCMEFVSWLYTNVISPIISFLVDVLLAKVGWVIDRVISAIETVSKVIITTWNTIKGVFNGIIEFIVGVFTLNWQKAWQGVQDIFGSIFRGLIDLAKMPLNAIIDLVNKVISGLNNIKMPDWVPRYWWKRCQHSINTKTCKRWHC